MSTAKVVVRPTAPTARRRRARLSSALAAALAALALAVVPTGSAQAASPWWDVNGPDAQLTSNGQQSPPSFSYDVKDQKTKYAGWVFSATAPSTSRVSLPWFWSGDHGRSQVRTKLVTGIYRNGDFHQVSVLLDEGPADRTGGFSHHGTTYLDVESGDRYGFLLLASHSEKTGPLRGTFTIASPPTVTVPASPLVVTSDEDDGAEVSFTASASDTYDGSLPVSCTPASGSRFAFGDTVVSCSATNSAGQSATETFTVRVYADEPNISWPTATRLQANDSRTGRLRQLDQAFWYRFPVQPDSTVQVDLTGLAANYDLVLFRDISQSFRQLLEPGDLNRLTAEFAADAYSPSVFSPSVFSPSVFSPSVFSPSVFSPSVFSPSVFSPSVFSPSVFSPSVFSPSVFSPSVFSPSVFSPAVALPSVFSPSVFSPSVFSPTELSDAFSSAQVRSLVAVSSRDGLADEQIRASTWNATGDFFIRVQGRNGASAPGKPFTISVTTTGGSCNAPLDTFAGLATQTGTPGSARTVILTDSDRLPGVPLAELRAFAARPDVQGVVVDAATIPRIAALNEQADDHVTCPYATNLVAQALRDVVNSYRDAQGALTYVVIAGGDHVVPFFRTADAAGLGPEQNYVPPVDDATASQASLRRNQVLSQDAYGAATDVVLKGATVPVADVAVGRLIETPGEIRAALDRYVALNGTLPTPENALVSGYDFLTDAADAVSGEFRAGLGGPGHTTELITDHDVPPSTTTVDGVPDRRHSWTADDLRSELFGARHDLVYLAGHFSANSALAADNETSVLTTELRDSDADLENALVLSAGCHSGYNIVDEHGVPGVTEKLDWPQAMSQQGAVLIAGTGYQYGDTDFLEYSERLYADVASELREGTGAVPLGRALLHAKQDYLATTPVLSGIHQKALLEATLYGLPMLGLDLPSGRTTAPDPGTQATSAVSSGPGSVLGLRTADVTASASLTAQTQTFEDPDGTGLTEFGYLRGRDGIVTSPGQPALPLQALEVGAPGQALRGVGFRGGTYTDRAGVVPLTGAPATEFSEVHRTFDSPVFFPRRLASVNTYGAIAGDGGTRLLVTPAQYRSDSAYTSVERRYSSTDFRLMYSANIARYGDNVPALAAPPTITGVGSTIQGNQVTVSAHVVGDPSAGIQNVWVTRTAERGPWHGAWSSLDLTQSALDSTRWTGTLTLPAGQSAQDVRFIVQAVNGVGLVTMEDNEGTEFVPGTSPGLDTDPVGTAPSALALSAAATGVYGGSLPVTATLTSGGPLSGRSVQLSLGSATRVVQTDAGGVARTTFPLVERVGDLDLVAAFGGDATTAPSLTTRTVSVEKRPTSLSLTSSPDPVVAGQDTGVTASLTAGPTAVTERPVVFVVRDGQGVVAAAVRSTDPAGKARLGVLALPSGSFTVTAYFGRDDVDVGGGSTTGTVDRENRGSTSDPLALRVYAPPRVETSTLPDATAGVPYRQALAVSWRPGTHGHGQRTAAGADLLRRRDRRVDHDRRHLPGHGHRHQRGRPGRAAAEPDGEAGGAVRGDLGLRLRTGHDVRDRVRRTAGGPGQRCVRQPGAGRDGHLHLARDRGGHGSPHGHGRHRQRRPGQPRRLRERRGRGLQRPGHDRDSDGRDVPAGQPVPAQSLRCPAGRQRRHRAGGGRDRHRPRHGEHLRCLGAGQRPGGRAAHDDVPGAVLQCAGGQPPGFRSAAVELPDLRPGQQDVHLRRTRAQPRLDLGSALPPSSLGGGRAARRSAGSAGGSSPDPMTTAESKRDPPGGDDPRAYLAEDRRRALSGGREVDGRVSGATLFADVSGFTALTEALAGELGPQRGAEELTGVLERVFHALIQCLHDRGGSVLYFSGDAITAWFEGDDGWSATSCAVAMQREMTRVGTVTSPAGRTVELGVKVAIAAGQARRFVVGDPAIQLIDVLAGALMDDVAAAEGAATPGDVVVTEPVLAALGDRVTTVERREGSAGPVGVVAGLAELSPIVDGGDEEPTLPDDVVREWLLPAVFRRMQAGRGEFVADLRPAVPMFLQFSGIDVDRDEDAPELFNAFIVQAQRVIDGYGGNLLQLTVGDKGAYLYAVFGAPTAHEDDAARACAAALDLLRLTSGGVSDLKIGLSWGRLRSGTYGHRHRRTFCCLGDAVNLAARLMSKAPAGGVLVSEQVRQAVTDRFEFAEPQLLTLKGKAHAAEVSLLLGTSGGGLSPVDHLPLIGREREVELLRAAVRSAADGGRVVAISGEVGSGKSRLVEECLADLPSEEYTVVVGDTPPYGNAPAYSSWWAIGRHLLGVPDDATPQDLAAHLTGVLPPDLLPRLPLLGTLLGTPLPDNALTAGFDAKLRKTSLESLATRLFELGVPGPTVLVLDDAHQMEPLSRDLLVALCRVLPSLPVTVLLSYRTEAEPFLGLELDRVTPAEELVLAPLGPEDTAAIATAELQTLFGAEHEVDAEVVRLVVSRADGNPLWVHELCRYLHERREEEGASPAGASLDTLDLPGSLHGLILSRLDRLPETPRRTAKVASVVGRGFASPLVVHGYPELGAEGDVLHALQDLAERDVAIPDDVATATWLFTHSLLRDVAYESLPFSLRTELHGRVARALESGVLGDPERWIDRLAHHYWHSDDNDKKRHYLRRAGQAAQSNHAHAAALLAYRRLLELLPDPERPEVLTQIGKILELQGHWAEAEEALTEARDLARRTDDRTAATWASTWLAELARKQGRYDEAAAGLAEAARTFAELADDAGAGQVWHLSGTLAAQQGDFETATRSYTESLALRERLEDRAGMAALFSNLAVVAEYQQDYARAEELGERALALRREIGDRWAIGVSQNNLGMLATLRGDAEGAKARFAESLALHEEVGDTWLVAVGLNNMGNAHRDLGETEQARDFYGQALTTYRRYDDRWVLAILYEDVALLDAATGRAEDAWRLVGASDAAREELGSPRTPDVWTRLHDALDDLSRDLPIEALRSEGAALGPTEVDRLVRAAGP